MTAQIVADGGAACSVLADLETYSGATDVIDRALVEFGRIDALVNNVGGTI